MQEHQPKDVRFGHDLAREQDENGVDLSLLRSNLEISVEQRLRSLEEGVRFAETVRPAHEMAREAP